MADEMSSQPSPSPIGCGEGERVVMLAAGPAKRKSEPTDESLRRLYDRGMGRKLPWERSCPPPPPTLESVDDRRPPPLSTTSLRAAPTLSEKSDEPLPPSLLPQSESDTVESLRRAQRDPQTGESYVSSSSHSGVPDQARAPVLRSFASCGEPGEGRESVDGDV